MLLQGPRYDDDAFAIVARKPSNLTEGLLIDSEQNGARMMVDGRGESHALVPDRRKLDALDGLRGLAVLLVL